MEEQDFEARLAKLVHDIEQLDAKIDDKISSLREIKQRNSGTLVSTDSGKSSLEHLTF